MPIGGHHLIGDEHVFLHLGLELCHDWFITPSSGLHSSVISGGPKNTRYLCVWSVASLFTAGHFRCMEGFVFAACAAIGQVELKPLVMHCESCRFLEVWSSRVTMGTLKPTKNDGKIIMFDGKTHYERPFSIATLWSNMAVENPI